MTFSRVGHLFYDIRSNSSYKIPFRHQPFDPKHLLTLFVTQVPIATGCVLMILGGFIGAFANGYGSLPPSLCLNSGSRPQIYAYPI